MLRLAGVLLLAHATFAVLSEAAERGRTLTAEETRGPGLELTGATALLVGGMAMGARARGRSAGWGLLGLSAFTGWLVVFAFAVLVFLPGRCPGCGGPTGRRALPCPKCAPRP